MVVEAIHYYLIKMNLALKFGRFSLSLYRTDFSKVINITIKMWLKHFGSL